MKKNKIYTGIFVIAVASASVGMLTGMEGQFRLADLGTRIYATPEQKVAIFTPDRNVEELQIEEWMYDLSSWAGMHEKEIVVEEWMTEPFEAGLAEEELVVEEWMTEPFEAGSAPCTDPDTRVSFPFTMIDF